MAATTEEMPTQSPKGPLPSSVSDGISRALRSRKSRKHYVRSVAAANSATDVLFDSNRSTCDRRFSSRIPQCRETLSPFKQQVHDISEVSAPSRHDTGSPV